jgi:L-lactate permease
MIRFACGFYKAMLWFYPAELRRNYGCDLVETFAALLTDSWSEGQFRGVLQVWKLALFEFLSIALPYQAVNPVLVVPLASVLGSGTILLSMVWALEHGVALNSLFRHAFGGH